MTAHSQVDVPVANATAVAVNRPGASVRVQPDAPPRLWEIQVWPRDVSIRSPGSFSAASFKNNFEIALFVDEALNETANGLSGQRISAGVRGTRLQLYAESIRIVVRCFANNAADAKLTLATRIVPAVAGVGPQEVQLVAQNGTVVSLPRFSTQYRLLCNPGAGATASLSTALDTHSFVDASGDGVVVNDVAGDWKEIPNGMAEEWTPLHPWAAGLQVSTGRLYVIVR